MQKQFFGEYAEKTGHSLVKVYADEGISGTKIKNRKQFLQLLKDAEKGLFEMVVVKDISRFARNTVDFLQSIRALKALGIETTFLTANMSVLGNSEFVLTIFGALAQEESANTSKRIKFSKKINAENGRVPNIVYGYDKTIGDYFNLAINEKEAAVVRQIYDWYIKDGHGGLQIANMLNASGIKTKRNCNWSQNGVCRILTNELYTGKVINGKQEVTDFLTGKREDKEASEWLVTENPELRIIDQETFEKAGLILTDRARTFKFTKERHSNKYLFSTLIKCKECGYSFRRAVRQYKNTYIRWICSQHNSHGPQSCSNAVTVDEDVLIEKLDRYFKETLERKKEVIKNLKSAFVKEYKAKDENENYEKALMDELNSLKKKRQKYMDMYNDDIISRQELNDTIGGIKEQIEKLETSLKLVEYNLSKTDQLENLIENTFGTIEKITSVKELTNSELREILEKIVIDSEGNVDVYLRVIGDLGLDETVLLDDSRT